MGFVESAETVRTGYPDIVLSIVQYTDNDIVILRNFILYQFSALGVVLKDALLAGGNPNILLFVLDDMGYP